MDFASTKIKLKQDAGPNDEERGGPQVPMRVSLARSSSSIGFALGRIMPPHTAIWFALLGLGTLIAGGFAARYLIREFRAGRIARAWLAAELCVALSGIALGCSLWGYTAQSSPTLKTIGFPFLAGVFELHDGRWEDYVGAITLPAVIGNFAVGMVTPHLILAIVVWACLKGRRHAA